MNMKDAFRFQNKLQTLMGTAQDMLHLLPCRQRIDPGAQCRAAQPTPITPSRRRKTQLIRKSGETP